MIEDRELTPSEVEDYKRMCGTRCPECDADTVECAAKAEADDEVVYRDNWCTTCKALWVEYFTITEVSVVERGVREEVT